jgi:hypothetical protein
MITNLLLTPLLLLKPSTNTLQLLYRWDIAKEINPINLVNTANPDLDVSNNNFIPTIDTFDGKNRFQMSHMPVSLDEIIPLHAKSWTRKGLIWWVSLLSYSKKFFIH